MSGNYIPSLPFKFGLFGFKLYTTNQQGTATIVEELGHGYDMDVRVLLPSHLAKVTEFEFPISTVDEEKARPHIQTAANNLRKPCPSSIVCGENKLCHKGAVLSRTYTLVDRVDTLMVFGAFERKRAFDESRLIPCEMGKVKGSGGWYVQMVIDYNRENYPREWKNLFVYDTNDEQWYELNKYDEDECEWSPNMDKGMYPFIFLPCTGIPLLNKKTGIVGGRDIDAGSVQALNTVFIRTVNNFFQFRQLVGGEYEKYVARVLHGDPDVVDEKPPPASPDIPFYKISHLVKHDFFWVWGYGFIRKKAFLPCSRCRSR